MTPEKVYDPQELVAVTMTVEQWAAVQSFLQFAENYHAAKRWEWLSTNCKDKKMCEENAAGHETAAAEAESLWKIIEATLYPPAKPATE